MKTWQNIIYKLNTNNFTLPYKIQDEIERVLLERLYTAHNVILTLYNLKTKIVP